MVASNVGQQLTLWCSQHGGRPSGGELALVENVRDRLAKRLLGPGPTQARLEEFLLWGLSLISVYVQAVTPEAERRRWTAQRRGELIYELLVIVAGRTHLLRPYRETCCGRRRCLAAH